MTGFEGPELLRDSSVAHDRDRKCIERFVRNLRSDRHITKQQWLRAWADVVDSLRNLMDERLVAAVCEGGLGSAVAAFLSSATLGAVVVGLGQIIKLLARVFGCDSSKTVYSYCVGLLDDQTSNVYFILATTVLGSVAFALYYIASQYLTTRIYRRKGLNSGGYRLGAPCKLGAGARVRLIITTVSRIVATAALPPIMLGAQSTQANLAMTIVGSILLAGFGAVHVWSLVPESFGGTGLSLRVGSARGSVPTNGIKDEATRGRFRPSIYAFVGAGVAISILAWTASLHGCWTVSVAQGGFIRTSLVLVCLFAVMADMVWVIPACQPVCGVVEHAREENNSWVHVNRQGSGGTAKEIERRRYSQWLLRSVAVQIIYATLALTMLCLVAAYSLSIVP